MTPRTPARSLERLRPKVALVRVTTTPEGAEVYIDRRTWAAAARLAQTLALPPAATR